MNIDPPVPSATASPVEHADWFEMCTIASVGGVQSLQNFTREIRRTGSTDAIADPDDDTYCSDICSETSEAIGEDAFAEVEWRLNACGGETAYPFTVGSSYLEFPEGNEKSIYVFLLLLSAFGKDASPPELPGAKLFEEVCGAAAKCYFGGADERSEVFVFGWPRSSELPKRFDKAVDLLCKRMGEGRKFKNQYMDDYGDNKDNGLDIVAWHDFSDRRTGKLIAFGQCATGRHWKGKTGDLDISQFCHCWLETQPTVPPVKLMFVPHRVEAAEWGEVTLRGGLCFDRCRVAFYGKWADQKLLDMCNVWNQHVIRERLLGEE